MYPAYSDGLNKETDEAVYFFTPAFYPLDNFSAHRIEVWGKIFATVEHAFQWKKFCLIAPKVAEEIFLSASPEAAWQIAQKHKSLVGPEWYSRRTQVMEEILAAKAEQHDDVRDALRRTGQREIVENNKVDDFWGIGSKGKGYNTLGKLWMKVRHLVYEKYI